MKLLKSALLDPTNVCLCLTSIILYSIIDRLLNDQKNCDDRFCTSFSPQHMNTTTLQSGVQPQWNGIIVFFFLSDFHSVWFNYIYTLKLIIKKILEIFRIEVKMMELGVRTHSDYNLLCYVDHRAMWVLLFWFVLIQWKEDSISIIKMIRITVHTEKYGVANVKPLPLLWARFPQVRPLVFEDYTLLESNPKIC